MIKIILGNSFSTIRGLQAGPFSALRDVLSYRVDAQAAFYAGGHRPRVKYAIDSKGTFATGLLARVEAFLKVEGIKYVIEDTRFAILEAVNHRPRAYTQQPYLDQHAAVQAAIENDGGCISMPTGTGKSKVIGMLVERMSLKTLIIVPSLEIKRQLLGTLSEMFGDLSNIRVENIDAKCLPKLKGFDCLIIDEAHHVAARTYQRLNKGAWQDIYYRFFLTATPFRNQTGETLLFEGIAGQVIFQLSYKDAVNKGYIVPIEAYYYELPKQKTEAYTWAQVYSELIVNNEYRNTLIAGLLAKLKNNPTLCLVKEVAHGANIADLTGTPFVHGGDDETREYIADFNAGRIKGLIGTTGIIGEGVDSRPAEYIIIAGLGKAKSAFMQAVGRGVRCHGLKESAKIIIFKDRSHKFCSRHFAAQCEILKSEYDVTPIKLEI